jgi:hypothetical protein
MIAFWLRALPVIATINTDFHSIRLVLPNNAQYSSSLNPSRFHNKIQPHPPAYKSVAHHYYFYTPIRLSSRCSLLPFLKGFAFPFKHSAIKTPRLNAAGTKLNQQLEGDLKLKITLAQPLPPRPDPMASIVKQIEFGAWVLVVFSERF